MPKSKFINRTTIQGYLFGSSIEEKTSQKGVKYLSGEVQVAIDPKGMCVIPVRFGYSTPFYDMDKQTKPNRTYAALQTIMNSKDKTVKECGENALVVDLSGAQLEGSEYYPQGSDSLVTRTTNRGAFINVNNRMREDEANRHKFEVDALITKFRYIEADPDKNINNAYGEIEAFVFNYDESDVSKIILTVRKPEIIDWYEHYLNDNGINENNPLFMNIWGSINNATITSSRVKENVFGGTVVDTTTRSILEWEIEGGSADFKTVDQEKYIKALQNREVRLAERKASQKSAVNANTSSNSIFNTTVNSNSQFTGAGNSAAFENFVNKQF